MLHSTHTNTTSRYHKVTALAKEVTSNLFGGETFDCTYLIVMRVKYAEEVGKRLYDAGLEVRRFNY